MNQFQKLCITNATNCSLYQNWKSALFVPSASTRKILGLTICKSTSINCLKIERMKTDNNDNILRSLHHLSFSLLLCWLFLNIFLILSHNNPYNNDLILTFFSVIKPVPNVIPFDLASTAKRETIWSGQWWSAYTINQALPSGESTTQVTAIMLICHRFLLTM